MLRERLIDQYGEDCRIRELRRTPRFAASVFVVDVTSGARHTRILGAIGKSGLLTEQSGMDLMRPERLVFLYERLMLIAFALVEQPRKALLLGLGGGAMCRHLAAYLGDIAVTVAEHDAAVIDLARRFFQVTQRVRHADAQDVVAQARGDYDVILADLYDGRGAVGVRADFWRNCARALKPGGCLAVNWAAFVENEAARTEAQRITEAFGRSFFIETRRVDENVVQLAPLDTSISPNGLAARWRRFALEHRLPREDREVLKRCAVRRKFPG